MGSRVAQLAKPFEICPGHRAFPVHVGAQKSRAEGIALRHHFFELKRDALAPAVNGDVSPGSVESDDDLSSTNFFCEPPQESSVHFPAHQTATSHNNLPRTPPGKFHGPRNR